MTKTDDKAKALEPLTDEQLRAIWEAAPCPETKQLLWEIRRLHNVISVLYQDTLNIARGYIVPIPAQNSVKKLVAEPAVQRYIKDQVRHCELVRPRYRFPLETLDDYKKWVQDQIDESPKNNA